MSDAERDVTIDPSTVAPFPGGRVEGFETLYRTEFEAMLRMAYLLVGSIEVAEEAVQDGFARLYERWSRVTNPGGYLRTCVVNRCRDLQRRKRVERQSPAPRADTTSELDVDELADALAALPIRRRAAIVLRYYDGLSEAGIAEVLGVAPGHREIAGESRAGRAA